ncbi:MAG TPA: DUF72 domain-containing protein [Candidatus Acidoferrales bacterium]|nr:DUF72 domain-containing protein [Candidatus Acidoferrales bacterium]
MTKRTEALKEYLIGAGGWAYFRVPGVNSLTAYSKVFNFVEVNSTFYQIPPLNEAEKWRRLVPPDFQFSVRAHRSITQTYRFQPVQQAIEAFEKMRKICQVLKANILHVQVPRSFRLSRASVEDLRLLFCSLDLGNVRVALEVRQALTQVLPQELLKIMQDKNMVHCVDLSKGEDPAYESDLLYTRLFGKGQHNIYQPTDEELIEIDRRAYASKSEKVAMSFHFVKMYKDAVRLKNYKQTGKFPMITRLTGISSLEEVLREDAEFPATKQQLIRKQGWKLFDKTETARVYAEEALQELPEGTYNSIDEVMDKLEHDTR